MDFSLFSGTIKYPPGLYPGPDNGAQSAPSCIDGVFSTISFFAIVKSPGRTHKLSWKCPGKVFEKCVQNSV